jgi:hypothetical protein
MPLRFGSIPRAVAVRAIIILSLAALTGAGALARAGAPGATTPAALASTSDTAERDGARR